jgi:methionyl aminopeptidase
MALAIEPMVTLGSPEVTVLADDWTVATIDGSVAAHWEHSVALTESGPVVLTASDGGVTRLAALGVTVGDVS